MWTRLLLVIALAAGCKDKDPASAPAPTAPAPSTSAPTAPASTASSPTASAATPVDLVALEKRFDDLMRSGDDVGSIAAGAELVAALRIAEPKSLRMANALTYYGMQLQVTGDLKLAQQVLEEALAHPATSTDHGLLAEVKFQLGALYTELRETDKAIAILRSAIELATETHGADSTQVTVMKESLASALDFAERYKEAEPLFREVLAAYEKSDDKVRIGRALTNLAVNLEFQERDPEALKLFMRAVEKLGDAKGYERSGLAEAHSGIGRVYRRQERDKPADTAFRKALAVRIEVLGPDHPLVALDYHNLAIALRDRKQLKEAREMCAKALAIRQAKLPADHPYRVGTEELCVELAAK